MLAAGEILAVIEVTRHPQGSSFRELVTSAYYASQKGVIVLVLNGVTPAEVDAVLDPIVPLLPLTIPGLRYCDVNDLEAFRDAVLRAREVRCHFSTLLRLEGAYEPRKAQAESGGPGGIRTPNLAVMSGWLYR